MLVEVVVNLLDAVLWFLPGQDPMAYPVWGHIDRFDAGLGLDGPTMTAALDAALADMGVELHGLTGPMAPKATVSTVVSCEATVDGTDQWVYVVHLVNSNGDFVAVPY